jgi:uncharacterized protein
MLYAVRFFDNPDRLAIRQQYLQAHIKWLDEHKETVLIGGSLRDAPSADPVGGWWLVDAPNKETVEALLRTDPFWRHDLRQGCEIHLWSKAFPDRKLMI